MKSARSSFLTPKLDELIRVYRDLERTLRALRDSAERSLVAESIHVEKLIDRLSRSKKELEGKISELVAKTAK